MAAGSGRPRSLDAALVSRLVQAALSEDGSRDLTSLATLPVAVAGRGVLLAKQALVVAGLAVAEAAFRALDPELRFEALAADGDAVGPGAILGTVWGRGQALLGAERTALNFLQRLSGVATTTRAYVAAVAGTPARIRDTRKTTPLLRVLEKYAVLVGGGVAHRSALDTGLLIKDNHIRLVGSVAEATRRAVATADGLLVEVEVERLEQIEEALGAGAGMLLLDNFTPRQVQTAKALVAGRVEVEVSGGVRLDTVRAYAEAGADFIAVGALTHSAPAVDISFEIERA